jgi:hypothetical protein
MKIKLLEWRIRFWASIERRVFARRHRLQHQLWTIRPPFIDPDNPFRHKR